MSKLPIPLKAADRVEIVTLMDNYSDVLLKSEGVVTRPSHTKDGVITTDNVVAEHGLSLFVTVYGSEERHTILFDTGHTEHGVPHNLKFLEMDINDIETIVLSHGHMDHTGSLYPILESLNRRVPVVVHPEAFHSPRFAVMDDGSRNFFPETLKREKLTAYVTEIVESKEPVLLAGDMILVTGQVERTTSYEKGIPYARLVRNGKEEKDNIKDDQSLVVRLKDERLVVISGCAHSGIVNTVRYGRKLTGIDNIHTIIGGFHLSGPAYEKSMEQAIEDIKEMKPEVIVPMHCTGWKAINRFSESFPDAFILNSVGSKYVFE